MGEIGSYEFGDEVARGARYVARAARDTELETDVLVVDIDLGAVDEDQRRALSDRIVAAIGVMADIKHENVIRALATTTDDDRIRVAFERFEGATVGAVMRDGRLPADAAIDVVSQVLAGVDVLAASGLDAPLLNPEAITLTSDGTAKVGGLYALPGLHELSALAPENMLSVIAYMAPEQLDGDAGDARSVVFSAGVLLRQMLTGENPFDAGQIPATMYRLKCENPPALDPDASDLPAFVVPLLMKAMSKDPVVRYASACSMRADLDSRTAPELEEEPPAFAPQPVVTTVAAAAPNSRRLSFSAKLAAVAIAAVFLIAGVAYGGYSYVQQQQAEEAARQEAIIIEGRVMASYVARLKSQRAELAACLSAMEGKAKSNAVALRAWDTEWKRRQAAYSERYDAVAAHNEAEDERDAAGYSTYTTYDYWYGYQTYNEDTYEPNYWTYPDQPQKPAKVKVDLAPERGRLETLENELNALRSEIASSTPSSRFFGPVYQALNQAATALSATAGDAASMSAVIVVQNPEKGAQIDPSKIRAINLGSLDVPFQQLDTQVAASLAGLKVTLQAILPETTSTPSASGDSTAQAGK